MRYYQVEMPMLQVVSLRKVQPGIRLEQPAYSEDGRVVMEEGRTVDEEDLGKLKRLNVRKIAVVNTQRQWIPETEVSRLSGDVKVLQTEEFSDAALEIMNDLQRAGSVEKLRKMALHLRQRAHQQEDRQAVEYLDEIIERADELEDEIDLCTKRLEQVSDASSRRQLLRMLEGKIRRLEETYLELSAPQSVLRNTARTVEERERIRTSLTDFVRENAQVVEASALEEVSTENLEVETADAGMEDVFNVLNRSRVGEAVEMLLQRVRSRRENPRKVTERLESLKREWQREKSTQRDLVQSLPEQSGTLPERKALLDVLEGRRTIDLKTLMNMSISRDYARRLFRFVEDRLDHRKRLWDLLDETSSEAISVGSSKSVFLDRTMVEARWRPSFDLDETPSEEESSGMSRPRYIELLRVFAEGNLHGGLQKLKEELEAERSSREERTEVRYLLEQQKQLDKEKRTLVERVEKQVKTESTRDQLRRLLIRPVWKDPREIMSLDAEADLLDEVAELVSRERKHHRRVRDLIGELKKQFVPGGEQQNDDAAQQEMHRRLLSHLRITDLNAVPDRPGASVRDLLRGEDPSRLATEVGISREQAEISSRQLADLPHLNGRQEILFRPLIQLTRSVFFKRVYRAEKPGQFQRAAARLLNRDSRPFPLLVQPPAGGQHLLAHGLNSSFVSYLLARYFELADGERDRVIAASTLKDLGMLRVPAKLWVHEDSLSPRGRREVNKHVDHTRGILDETPGCASPVIEHAFQHHERSDGSGYPDGLQGNQRRPFVPILAVADVYTALIERRPHRERTPPDKALLTLFQNKRAFDPVVIRALVETVGIYPNGCVVSLTDGRRGLVKQQNPSQPPSPEVLVIRSPDGERLSPPKRLDLSRERSPSVDAILQY